MGCSLFAAKLSSFPPSETGNEAATAVAAVVAKGSCRGGAGNIAGGEGDGLELWKAGKKGSGKGCGDAEGCRPASARRAKQGRGASGETEGLDG